MDNMSFLERYLGPLPGNQPLKIEPKAATVDRPPYLGPQTVEDIVARGYLVISGGDPATALVTDRTDTSRLALEDAISQIRARYALHRQAMYQLQQARLAASNEMHTWEAERGSLDTGQLAAVHAALQDLYRQERLEDLNLWRDISRLRSELPEAAREYLSAYRRHSLLLSPGGGGP